MNTVKAKAILIPGFGNNRSLRSRQNVIDGLSGLLLSMTGLKNFARRKISRLSASSQSETSLQKLYILCNRVADGGYDGLKAAIKACFLMKK